MAPGSPVSDLTRTSPRTPWAAPNTPMRIRRSGARKVASGGGRFGGLGGGSLGGRGALLRLLARLGLFRVQARFALGEAEAVEQAQHAIGRLRALGEPGLGLLLVEREAACVVLGLHRIERADLLDEAAIARRAGVGDDDAIERALLRARAGEPDFQGHFRSSFSFIMFQTGVGFLRSRVSAAEGEERRPPSFGGVTSSSPRTD